MKMGLVVTKNKQNILKEAERLAQSLRTWADLSNALFDPIEGLISRFFPTLQERKEFRKTKIYDQLHTLVEMKMKETGVVAGANPKKSGKFVVRLPRSLHAALEREAEAESTSLNQLVVTKLAVQLDNIMGGRLASLIQAFGEVRSGYSLDRVIADPELDRKFLRRCRELGLSGTDYVLNWEIVKARKKGELSHLPKTKRYTIRETDEFEYASKLAVRFLERTQDVSLDKIICDPQLAEEFDKYAERLAPGFSPLEYRWVALGLRKAGRRSSEKLPALERLGRVDSFSAKKVPETGGLYLFLTDKERVFVSQTDNLRHRFERHMDVSNSHGLPDWLWNVRKNPLQIGIASLPEVRRSIRQAMELMLVRQWKPVLNFVRRVA